MGKKSAEKSSVQSSGKKPSGKKSVGKPLDLLVLTFCKQVSAEEAYADGLTLEAAGVEDGFGVADGLIHVAKRKVVTWASGEFLSLVDPLVEQISRLSVLAREAAVGRWKARTLANGWKPAGGIDWAASEFVGLQVLNREVVSVKPEAVVGLGGYAPHLKVSNEHAAKLLCDLLQELLAARCGYVDGLVPDPVASASSVSASTPLSEESLLRWASLIANSYDDAPLVGVELPLRAVLLQAEVLSMSTDAHEMRGRLLHHFYFGCAGVDSLPLTELLRAVLRLGVGDGAPFVFSSVEELTGMLFDPKLLSDLRFKWGSGRAWWADVGAGGWWDAWSGQSGDVHSC